MWKTSGDPCLFSQPNHSPASQYREVPNIISIVKQMHPPIACKLHHLRD